MFAELTKNIHYERLIILVLFSGKSYLKVYNTYPVKHDLTDAYKTEKIQESKPTCIH